MERADKKRKHSPSPTVDDDADDIIQSQSPAEASQLVKDLLSLDENEKQSLQSELEQEDEDPILVCKVNHAWIAAHSQVAADAVLDEIANWTRPAAARRGRRRDAGPGCYRWIFHFADSQDIIWCKNAIMNAHPNAFGIPPAIAARGGINPIIGLAECVKINRVAIRNDDAESYDFFY
jgi:hypothetical protein